MSYIDDPQNEDDTTSSTSSATGTGSTVATAKKANAQDDSGLTSGSDGTIVSGASGSSGTGQTAPVAKPTDSGWTNLNSYLNTNQDQAAQMGNDVAGKLTDQATGAQSSLKSVNDDFNSKAVAPTLGTEQANIDAAVQDPTSYASDSSKLANIQNDLSANYTGPKSIQDDSGYANAVSKYNTAQQNLSLTGSESGRMNLLQNQYARPDYNQGQQSLDQLLLENNPDAQNSLSNVNNKFSGLMNEIGQATTASQAIAAQKASDAKNTSSYANTAIGNAANTQSTTYQDRLKADIASDDATRAQSLAISNAIANNQLTAEQAKLFGLNGTTNSYGVNAANYLKYDNGTNATANNVTSAEEAAKINALFKLLGQDSSSQYSMDPAAHGTYVAPKFNVDTQGYQAALTQAHTAYDAALNQKKSVGWYGPNPVSVNDMQAQIQRDWGDATYNPNRFADQNSTYNRVWKYINQQKSDLNGNSQIKVV